MNNLDKKYTDLLQDILDNGVKKEDRTGTGTISVFGRQIRHKMSEGFPLLTTKKMYFKGIVTELLWFLRGDTNIEYLVHNDCHIWDGDAYKRYVKENQFNSNAKWLKPVLLENGHYGADLYTKEEFINKIKTDNEFAEEWGELGPVYGKQWRKWERYGHRGVQNGALDCGFITQEDVDKEMYIDQIATLINDLKTNPDSRRLMVNSWNVGEIDQMVLPPCHYGFQCYTRELSHKERCDLFGHNDDPNRKDSYSKWLDDNGFPKRAISLMWNQRSVDTPLGLPFNIASYGLLLTMIADEVNMVTDEVIGNLGDCHIYLNQIEGVKEQIGREFTLEERIDMASKCNGFDPFDFGIGEHRTNAIQKYHDHEVCDAYEVPRRTREPYPLPTVKVQDGIECSSINDVILLDYKSHPTIKFPLSN